MRRRLRGLVGIAAALIGTACGSGGVAAVHGATGALPPATISKTPTSVFVANGIALPVMSVTEHEPSSYIRAVATVYQPDAKGDGTSTPFLAAMFAPGEDCCSSFPGLRGPEVQNGFRSLQVQGRPGAIGGVGKDELIVWTTPPTSQESDEAAVLGAGISDAELRRAAGGARANEHSAMIVDDALPSGYRPVATGPINIGLAAVADGFAVHYGNSTSYVLVETAAGGADLFAMARATTAGRTVHIAGHDTWAGPAVIDGDPVQRYLWRAGDDIVAVDARGVADEQVQRIIASLRREPRGQALHQLREQVSNYPAQQLTHPGEDIAVSVHVGSGIVAVVVDATKAGKLLLDVRSVGLAPDALGVSTGWASGENRASWETLADGQSFVYGSTPLPVATVVLRGPNGKSYPTTLGHAASHPELTFFAAVVRENGEPPNYRVFARDNQGHALATWRVT